MYNQVLFFQASISRWKSLTHSLLTGWIGLLFSVKVLENGMIRRPLWSHHAKSCSWCWAKLPANPPQFIQSQDQDELQSDVSKWSMAGLLKGLCLCLHNPGAHYFTTLSTCKAMPPSTMLCLLRPANTGPRWWTDLGWKCQRFWKEAQQKAGPICSKSTSMS